MDGVQSWDENLYIFQLMTPPPLDHGNKSKDDGGEASGTIVVDEMGAVAGDQTAAKDNAPPVQAINSQSLKDAYDANNAKCF